MDRVRVSVWDLERMVMEIGFESEWVYVSVCLFSKKPSLTFRVVISF